VFSSAWVLAIALTLQAPAGSPRAATADRPFPQMIQHLALDARAVPSRDSALLLGAGGIAAIVMHQSDDGLAAWAAGAGRSSYTVLGGRLGDGWVQGGAAVVTYVAGALSRDATMAHVGSNLIRAQLLNGAITETIKLSAARARPNGGRYSFPSGHASAAFTSAAVLDGQFGWKTGVPAYAAATFIGWTRVRDDAHWLSDVIVGGTIGTIVGRTIASHSRNRTWTIAPAASAHSVSVVISKRPGH
jgi:membrane-associated phospholipid phosphatase